MRQIPHVGRRETRELLGGCGASDGQHVLGVTFLPVVGVVLQHAVTLHCALKQQHQQLPAGNTGTGQEEADELPNAKKKQKNQGANLVVGLGEVIQSKDVVQEGAELCRKVLEHQAVVVRLF